MADRKLALVFPDAGKPMDQEEAESFVCSAKKKFGEIDTFFGLPVYQNPVGIEVEIEGWQGVKDSPYYWSVTDDGSLKDHGAELISLPLRGRNIDYALHELAHFHGCHKWKFSHRTSVHVHCNVSTYTKYQLRALIAVYACMEELYFSFVEDKRRGNSFCYRLVGTPAEIVVYSNDKEGSECTKYCAFNIQPIRRQLTVEFRHLEGTQDRLKLRRWIQLCSKLVGTIATWDPKECTEIVYTALTKNGMPHLIKDILGDTGAALFSDRQIAESVNNGELWALTLLTKDY